MLKYFLSASYKYSTLIRVKRGFLDKEFKDGFLLSIKLPGTQWTKELGNEALGAAFGIVVSNEMEIEISKLL